MKNSFSTFLWALLIVAVLLLAYFVVDGILYTGVRPTEIKTEEFQAKLFKSPNASNNLCIVLVGGGDWGDYWAQEFAKKSYIGLSLPYYRKPGLPELLEDIPLEYFESALNWCEDNPEFSASKIIVMGASRNAELALVIAANFPKLIDGVVAYSPSSVAWSNTVMPFNSPEIGPSWTYHNRAIPYIPMERFTAPPGAVANTLDFWESGLQRDSVAEFAAIEVGEINGPILLFSGKDDKVWPSAFMANQIEQRLQAANFNYSYRNVQFEDAGHMISGKPSAKSDQRFGRFYVGEQEVNFAFGGTPEGDLKAKQEAQKALFEFLEDISK